jgi:photosystem II stability/assembly factor-like uncharacterized protein
MAKRNRHRGADQWRPRFAPISIDARLAKSPATIAAGSNFLEAQVSIILNDIRRSASFDRHKARGRRMVSRKEAAMSSSLLRKFSCLAVLCCFAVPSIGSRAAAPGDNPNGFGHGADSRFSPEAWEPFGPSGAQVLAMELAPANPNRLLLVAGPHDEDARGELVFRSDDGGRTWEAKGEGIPTTPASRSVAAVAFDPGSPDRVFVGIGGLGVFLSETGGDSWTEVGDGLDDLDIHALKADPRNPATIYAGTRSGLYRSDDRGGTWRRTGLRHRTFSVSLASGDSTIFAGTEFGLYDSSDAGRTWRKLTEGYGSVYCVVVHPADSQLVLLSGSSSVRISRDGGENWESAGVGGTVVSVHPTDTSRLYVGSRTGSSVPSELHVSTDGGATWAASETRLDDAIRTLVVAPGDPGVVYAGTESGGVFRSRDGGLGLVPSSQGLPGVPAWSIALDPRRRSRILVGVGSESGGILGTEDGGSTWSRNRGTSGFPTMSIAFGTGDDGRAYAGTVFGFLYSNDWGSCWRHLQPSGFFDPNRRVSPAARALAVDPRDPMRLYAGVFGVLRSTDGGMEWSSRYLGMGSPEVYALAIDPTNSAIVYAATADGVFRSDNHADTWTRKSRGLPDSPVRALVPDPSQPETLFVGTADGVYRSTDGADHWEPAGPPGESIRVLAIDPKSPSGVIYAGTDTSGVFRSLDGGASWEEWSRGLGDPSVLSLAIDSGTPSVVYVGTWSGLFRRADGSALYFAQYGDGRSPAANIRSELLLANPGSAAAVRAVLEVLDDAGFRLPAGLGDAVGTPVREIDVPASGVRRLRTDGIGDVVKGSLTVTSESTLAGTLLYSGGVGLAGVGAGARFDRPFLAPVLNEGGRKRTALAVMNLESRTVSLALDLRDGSGRRVAGSRLDLPALGHAARFIDELEWTPFDGPEIEVGQIRGSVRLAPDGRVAALVVLTTAGEIATLPVAPESPPGDQGGLHGMWFAHFAEGIADGHWVSSRVLVVNRSPESSARVTVDVRDPQGSPPPGEPVEGAFQAELPPGGMLDLAFDGRGPLRTGSVRVESDRPVSGLLLFEGSAGFAGVLADVASAERFLIPVDNRAEELVRTGLALVGAEGEGTSVEMILRNADGVSVASTVVGLPSRGHVSRYVDEYEWIWETGNLDLSSFLGSVECLPSGEISAVAIQTRFGQYATFPVVPLK